MIQAKAAAAAAATGGSRSRSHSRSRGSTNASRRPSQQQASYMQVKAAVADEDDEDEGEDSDDGGLGGLGGHMDPGGIDSDDQSTDEDDIYTGPPPPILKMFVDKASVQCALFVIEHELVICLHVLYTV